MRILFVPFVIEFLRGWRDEAIQVTLRIHPEETTRPSIPKVSDVTSPNILVYWLFICCICIFHKKKVYECAEDI